MNDRGYEDYDCEGYVFRIRKKNGLYTTELDEIKLSDENLDDLKSNIKRKAYTKRNVRIEVKPVKEVISKKQEIINRNKERRKKE